MKYLILLVLISCSSLITNPKKHQKTICEKDTWLNYIESASRELKDLNEDSKAEQLESCSCGNDGNCTYELYLSQADHYIKVGPIHGAKFKILETKTSGLLDIMTLNKRGCGGNRFSVDLYKFDGKRYHNSKIVNCEADDECIPRWSRPDECKMFNKPIE